MFQALRDEATVKPIYQESVGSIILPKGLSEFKQYNGEVYGEVLSVGSKNKLDIKAGDKINWQRHEGKRFWYQGELYLAIKERWIMGRMEDGVMKPLGDRVVIKPLAAEAKTKGGIVLPDTAKEKPQEGEVVAVGTGKLMDNGTVVALLVKVGDKVLYGKYSGNEITTKDGDKLLIMREEDILMVMDNGK